MNRRQLLQSLASIASAALVSRCMPKRTLAAGPLRSSQVAPESRFLSVNGVRLHYLDWGNDRARPLVLLHAGFLNAHAWDAFARAMAPHFHVIAPDARGHGESEWKPPYLNDVLVADVHALVEALGLAPFVLCGNSMGGSIAMAYASRHPDRVERLILVDTGPGPKPSEPRPPAPPAGIRPAGPPQIPPGPFSSREDAVAQLTVLAGPEFARIMTHENLKQDSTGAWLWKYDHEGTAGGFERSMQDPRRWPYWLAVKCPTLVLRGARSPALSQAAAEEMVRENPNASLVVIPDAGHFIAMEQPAAFERAVRNWLGV